MSKSYRIRTQVGVDKAVNVSLEQDFESLEILSLKILQNQIYTRQCSDYGVVVGRVSANNGFGLPNVKVSIFIPLSDEDELNPIISELYPYKTLNDLNEDGYRYNLLPYEVSHGGHTPTGTFPSREDVLVNQGLIEVFDKYYKYTAKTNDSGDFMIFGVPIGPHTLHIDFDLSDIGEFSLSPQDLIRLNLATEGQVDGTKFRSSTNLGELPQIKQANRTVEVVPLWGQPEICYLGITRVDFDLSQEFGIKIEPASVFMGSIISNVDEKVLKKNCKVDRKLGNLCSLITGPGEILAIRQTINTDSSGRPLLESFNLENGGKCIDENGTWLIDVPMNLDYVYTSESGERLISTDPSVGIPTKGKYRFKIKWQQPNNIEGKIIRANFLAPNIKEWGWEQTDIDPSIEPQSNLEDLLNFTKCQPPKDSLILTPGYSALKASYAFSVDWDDYGGGPNYNEMITEAIRCEDRFYEMVHSKVYTISQLITEHRGSRGNKRYIAIRDLLNEECESTTNKFPSNDGQFQADILYSFFTFMIGILVYVFSGIITLLHAVAAIVCALYIAFEFLATFIGYIKDFICWIANLGITIAGVTIRPFYVFVQPLCGAITFLWKPINAVAEKLKKWCKDFNLPLPSYVYDDCEFCDCGGAVVQGEEIDPGSIGYGELESAIQQAGGSALLSNFFNAGSWECGGDNSNYYGQLMAGNPYNIENSGTTNLTIHAPQVVVLNQAPESFTYMFTTSLTFPERFNLFNTKSKYFDSTVAGGNLGGGWNRIKSSFNIDMNPSGSTWHADNIMVLMVKDTSGVDFTPGNMFTCIDKDNSQDPNSDLPSLTGNTQFGNKSTTGTTYGTPVLNSNGDVLYYEVSSQEVKWSNWNGLGESSTYYTLTGTSQDYMKFPIDVEYFQVIKETTVGDFLANSVNTSDNSGLRDRILTSDMRGLYIIRTVNPPTVGVSYYASDVDNNTEISCLTDFLSQKLIFMVRGVDPYSSRTTCAYDLSRIYGVNSNFSTWTTNPEHLVVGNFKLNIPIRGALRNVRHDIPNNDSLNTYTFNNQNLFYPSYSFIPDTTMFTSFDSSATTLYSKYDANNIGSVAGGAYASYLVTNDINGLRVNINNWYTKEFYEAATTTQSEILNGYCYSTEPYTMVNFYDEYNYPGTGRNRGYFYYEIVEGSGVMILDASSYQPTQFLPPSTWSCPTSPTGPTSIYVAEKYPITDTISFTDSNRIVMRADRLPTGSVTQNNGILSYPMATNQYFSMYSVSDDGVITPNLSSPTVGAPNDAGNTADNQSQMSSNPSLSAVSNSFTCEGLVPLSCYEYDENTGYTILKPPGDDCYTNNTGVGDLIGVTPEPILVGGCYKLITVPVLSLALDIALLSEWAARTKMAFAACRNVYGHIFTNHWINGTLFMFPVANQKRFTSPLDSPPSQAYSCSCSQLIFTDYDTNTLYYRIAPYRHGTGFIGRDNPKGLLGVEFDGNVKNLQNPTTLIDLGPRTDYTQQLVQDDKYEGYIMGNISTTSFQDVSDLLNQFILSRMLSQSYLGQLISMYGGIISGGSIPGVDPVASMFSRPNRKVDADYAQMVAINSQMGVSVFDSDDYFTPEPGAVPSAPNGYYFQNPSSSQHNVFGIFYKSNTQLRDWISPHRLVVNENGDYSNPCTYEDVPIFTQEVPFYQWEIKQNEGAGNDPIEDSIFGDQKNEWYTNPSTIFFSSGYQDMDRLNSDYMQPVDGNIYTYHKGYIYNVNGGQISSQPPQAAGPDRIINNSGPYYFYFGLSRGKSAFDRFLTKWINSNADYII